MIYHLIDEYNYFSDYPEQILQITGRLYGHLINEALIDGKSL
jgi:hypothetical protein